MNHDKFIRDTDELREMEEARIEHELNPDFALISDYVAGELDEERAEEVRARLEAEPEFRDLAEPLLLAWSVPPKTQPLSHDELRRSWLQLRRRAGMPPVPGQDAAEEAETLRRFYERDERAHGRATRARALVAAGIFALLVGLPVGMKYMSDRQANVVVQTDTPNTLMVALPDGSRATLSGGSWMKRARAFGSAGRQVVLRGEAAFDVEPFRGGQFVVITEAARIVVTGTSFMVTAYAGGPTTVSVKSGVVTVQGVGEDGSLVAAPVQLRAGESVRVFKGLAPEVSPRSAQP